MRNEAFLNIKMYACFLIILWCKFGKMVSLTGLTLPNNYKPAFSIDYDIEIEAAKNSRLELFLLNKITF